MSHDPVSGLVDLLDSGLHPHDAAQALLEAFPDQQSEVVRELLEVVDLTREDKIAQATMYACTVVTSERLEDSTGNHGIVASEQLADFAFGALSWGYPLAKVVESVNDSFVEPGERGWTESTLRQALLAGPNELRLDEPVDLFVAAVLYRARQLRSYVKPRRDETKEVWEMLSGQVDDDLGAFADARGYSPTGLLQMIVGDFLYGTNDARLTFGLRSGQAAMGLAQHPVPRPPLAGEDLTRPPVWASSTAGPS